MAESVSDDPHLRDLFERIRQLSLSSQLRLAAALLEAGEWDVAQALAWRVGDDLGVGGRIKNRTVRENEGG